MQWLVDAEETQRKKEFMRYLCPWWIAGREAERQESGQEGSGKQQEAEGRRTGRPNGEGSATKETKGPEKVRNGA